MSKVSITDKVVQTIRLDLSDIACNHEKNDRDLHRFIGVESSRSYNFVLDSLYLLEDTQIGKKSFREKNLPDQDLGTLYLLYYGLFNACYMQQQALLVVSRELGISDGLEPINKAQIIDFRNSFSAHSPNRGHGASQHSFILDRHAMLDGRVEGYSANHSSGHHSLQGSIFELLDSWDEALDDAFLLVGNKIYGESIRQKI